MSGTEPTNTEQAAEQTPATPQADGQTQQPAAPTVEQTPAAEPTLQTTAQAGNTVNAYKHQREVAKLEAERDAAKAEAEGYKELKAEFEAWKAEQATAKTDAALKAAGCHDVVAAAARLGEFDGDVEKLKEAAPYLFNSTDSTKKTGGNPKGSPDPDDERTKKMRSIMGLKDKE